MIFANIFCIIWEFGAVSFGNLARIDATMPKMDNQKAKMIALK